MIPDKTHSIYFLGIGGIGMSALARYFLRHGYEIHGYDRVRSELCRQLEKEGMHIHYEENPNLIPSHTGLVVYTPAIPHANNELRFCEKRKLPMMKRSAMLGKLTEGMFTIAVAGTHGKTSISATLSHLLKQQGIPFTAMIGGISNNLGSNMYTVEKSKIMLVEADEFDKSFLQLKPDVAVISSTDADHLDIYHDHQNLVDTFSEFAGQIKPGGVLVCKQGLEVRTHARKIIYNVGGEAEVIADNIRVLNHRFYFDLLLHGRQYVDIEMGVPGRHNIENALAALAILSHLDADMGKACKSLASYKGVWRRFDKRVENNKTIYIDDYAHHPSELDACINAARELYPDKKITAVFQPHLYSRTRDLMDEFARSLEKVDTLLLMDIYPAREEPIPGIDSGKLLEKINHKNKYLYQAAQVIEFVRNDPPELLLTLGAGDIDRLVAPLENVLSS